MRNLSPKGLRERVALGQQAPPVAAPGVAGDAQAAGEEDDEVRSEGVDEELAERDGRAKAGRELETPDSGEQG